MMDTKIYPVAIPQYPFLEIQTPDGRWHDVANSDSRQEIVEGRIMSGIIGEYPRDGLEYDGQCARCGSSVERIQCEDCEDGFNGHDCGEDCCCCAEPEENVVCDTCHGFCGWWRCCSSPEWCRANPLPGRESTERGLLEWFLVEREDDFGS